jgi:MurNAc alpha-1-phosphate uridylyltransferase
VIAGVVLAAGPGTRLQPLTDILPKALCPVDNVALVDHALARVRPVAPEVAVNVCAGRDAMEAHLAGRDVHLSFEDDGLLGTAGALGRLRPWIEGRHVLVTNADAWHRFDLRRLVEGWDGVRPRLLVVHDPARGDFGPWRYVGSCLLAWAHVAPLASEPSGLFDAVWRGRGRDLDLVAVEGEFFDCGTPSDYLAANLAASGGASVVGPGAVVEGELVRSVVWPGGVVRAGERLVESVRVGRDLTVRAPLPVSPPRPSSPPPAAGRGG